MAANKKSPPKKPAAKKTGAGSPARKRQASRPPTIELKAEEVVDMSKAKPAAKKADKTAEDKNPPREKPAAKSAEKTTQSKASEVPKTDSSLKDAPAPQKTKTPLIAAGLAGLLAGTAGGIIAGLVLTGTGPDLADEQRLTALQDRVQKVESAQEKSGAPLAITSRIEKSESDFRFLKTQFETLQKDIGKLKEQLAIFASTATPTTEGGVSPQLPSVDISGLESKITSLQQQLEERNKTAGELAARLELLQKTYTEQQAMNEDARAKTESTVKESTAAYASLKKDVDEKIQKLYQAGGDNRIRAAALSLSLRQLSDAVNTSSGFASELQATASLLGPSENIERLKAVAETGAPNLAALRSGFEKIKPAKDGRKPVASDGTILDRIVSNAKSVVRVRKLGEETKTPPDPMLGLRQKLQAGDLEAVIKLSNDLDENVKTLYGPWLDRVQKRLSLNGLFAKLQNEILAEIGKASTPAKQPEQAPPPPAPPVPPTPEAKPAPEAPSQKAEPPQIEGAQ